ncbi:MAG: HEAT repeat domain-containing protein, partial [Planctomycetota bacterium]|nr:HEAT repeat domain-containing protein [Planctomycetota bacterium]
PTVRGAIDTLAELLSDPEPEIRAQAARVLGDEDCIEAKRELQRLLAKEEDPRVLMYVALAFRHIGSDQDADALFDLLDRVGDSDPVLRHSVVMGLTSVGTMRIKESFDDPSPHVRMGCVLVMRRRHDGSLKHFLDDSDPRIVREAAIAIHDEFICFGIPELARLITRPELRTNAVVRRVLNAAFLSGQPSNARALATYALREDQEEGHRVEALEMLADWEDPSKIDRVLGRWHHTKLGPRQTHYLPGVLAQLADRGILDAPPAVVETWIRTASSVSAPVGVHVTALVRDVKRPSSTRVAAIEAFAALDVPDRRDALSEALADVDGDVRAAALDALLRLAPEDALPLLRTVVVDGEWPERRVAYRALGTLADPRADEVLRAEVLKLAQDRIPAELALDLVLAAEARGDEALDRALEEHRRARQADAELAPWLDSLFGGDRRAGHRIFRADLELSCLRCHRDVAEGEAQIGPDLVDLGERLTRLQILAAIVAPNRRVPAGYETTTFFLKGGDVLEGRVVAEDERVVAIVISAGEVVSIDRSEIEESRPGLSAMPKGLAQSLSREEMRDLIQYLASL